MNLVLIVAALRKIPAWLVVTAIAFLALNYVETRGYERRDAELAIEMKRQREAHDAEIEKNQIDAQAREDALTAELVRAKAVANQRATTLAAHLKTQQRPKETSNATDPHDPTTASCGAVPGTVLLGDAVLDGRTVRLLNEARANTELENSDASAWADEEGRATSITGADLALNDLEVVRMYHELAERHSGLVDLVYKQCLRPGLDKSALTR